MNISQRRSLTSVVMALAVAAIVPIGIAGCGDSDDSSKGNAVDRAFATQMIPHHQMAVHMGQAAQTRAQHAQIKTLAADIIRTQNAEIEQLRKMAKSLGSDSNGHGHGMDGGSMGRGMAGDASTLGMSQHQMGMSMNMGMLDRAKPFDRAFIDMMIPHHQGAIRMARAELAKGKDPEMKKLARAIVAAQSSEIREMNRWRTEWYGKPSPAGGVPAP